MVLLHRSTIRTLSNWPLIVDPLGASLLPFSILMWRSICCLFPGTVALSSVLLSVPHSGIGFQLRVGLRHLITLFNSKRTVSSPDQCQLSSVFTVYRCTPDWTLQLTDTLLIISLNQVYKCRLSELDAGPLNCSSWKSHDCNDRMTSLLERGPIRLSLAGKAHDSSDNTATVAGWWLPLYTDAYVPKLTLVSKLWAL